MAQKKKRIIYSVDVAMDPTTADPARLLAEIKTIGFVQSAEIRNSRMRVVDDENDE